LQKRKLTNIAAQYFREMNFEDHSANSFLFLFLWPWAAIKDLYELLFSDRECHHQTVNSHHKFTDLAKINDLEV